VNLVRTSFAPTKPEMGGTRHLLGFGQTRSSLRLAPRMAQYYMAVANQK